MLSSCKNGGVFNKISVVSLVDPDKVAPIISINSIPTTLNGDQTYTLNYDVEDNQGGSGIKRLEIYYSPDGVEANYKYLGNGPVGLNSSVDICVPNKNHSQPTFKVLAYDKSGNKTAKYIGNVSGQNFSIVPSTPTVPTLTSSRGTLTKNINTDLAIAFCPQTQCSASSLKYENYPTNKYVLFNNAAQPLAADAGWVSCSTILANKYTVPNFTVDGAYTYKVWTKTTDTEFDHVTPINLISATSNQITVTYDKTAPTLSLANLTTVGGGLTASVTFTQSDLNSVASNKLQYAADGVTFVDVASNITSPYSWTVPMDNTTTAKLKLIATDTPGNVAEITNNAFTVDSVAPSSPVATLTSPYISSSTTVTMTVPNCTDTTHILIGESPIAPAANDANWQSCVVAPTNLSQVLTGPVTQGLHNLYVWAKDAGNNISLSTPVNMIYDTVNPTINLTAFGTLYKGGDSITLNFSTTDANGVSAFKLEYSPDGVTYGLLSNLAVGATSYTWTIPVANTSLARFRLTSVDNATTANQTVLVSSNFTIDTTPPSTAALFVEGTTITGKSFGTYRISDCSDVAKVMVQRVSTGTPLDTDSGWQTCSSTNYSITTNDFLVGDNNLKFWVKDGAGNVAPAYLGFTTKYTPPTFNVVNGPTISTPVADITIQFCDEASITKVLFNETGTTPIGADVLWQTCNTAVGALKSQTLSPGPHTLKAFFKYADGVISKNPIDVYVNYTSTLTWAEPPSVNRPQTKFTLATCAGIDKVFLNKSTAPLATDPGWQNCSTAVGGLTFDGLAPGVNTINAWFKDASNNLFSNYASTTATYVPPQANLNNGTTVQDTTAKLTITDCNNISQVYVGLDTAVQPGAGDAGWVSCTTANNAISSPVLGTNGSHTLYTWFKYTDNYILPDPDIDNIIYDPYDVTPPDIAGVNPGNTAITLTLNNGYDEDANVTTPLLLVKDNTFYAGTQDNVSRAQFTINTCTPTGSANPKEDIAAVLISTEANINNISASNPYWQACSTAAKAIQSASFADSADLPLYFYFKDASGNIAGYGAATNPSQTVHVKINTAIDVTPPPRPYVEITTPPTLTMSPAQMWVNDPNNCNDIDQVYVNIYSRKYDGLATEILDEAQPLKTAAGWQACQSKPGVIPNPIPLSTTFNFPIILSGSYTLKVWFKDAAGNINPDPRHVSFIFDPIPSAMPNPIAYWSFDQNHFYKNKAINIKGNDHLSVYPYVASDVSKNNGKVKEGYNFSGNKYALTKNSSTLKPTVSVSMSAWISLTNGDVSNKFIAGNMLSTKGYGLTLEGGFLRFYVNGRKAEVDMTTVTTGIHNVVGSADGRYIYLYIDGNQVGSDDSGAPANIDEGMGQVFAVGVKPNASTNYDTGDPRFFNGKIDELVVWDKYLTSTQVFRHYVDGMNILKVNEQHTTLSPTLASSAFYGDFMQNALLTIPTCTGISFVYVNETTHPPTANSNWQPCTTLPGAIVLPNLAQGYHQLKVWTKDSYDNISASYALVDTTITSIVYQAPPETYFTLDNAHYLNSAVRDLFSGFFADIIGGASTGQTGVGFKNEGFYFTATSQQYVEAMYATPTQLTDKITLSSWAKLTKNDNRDQIISGNTAYSIYINQANNEMGFQVNTGAGIRKATVATSYYNTGYHNIIGSYDGRYVTLFLDGNQVASIDYTTTEAITYSCMSSFTIGAGATCNLGAQANTYFDGGIDEVIAWNDALTPSVVHDFFNGQDNVPPLPVNVEPKGNTYDVHIPIASFRVLDCSDIASVYVTLGSTKPTTNTANWQACNQTAYTIKSPLLDDANDPLVTPNLLHFWFKDAAGNVSDTSTDVTINYLYDFTVPNPMAYWPFDIANSHDQIASDVFGGHDATKVNTALVTGTSDEAIALNGSSAFAEVPYDVAFALTDKVTLSAWFKIGSYPAGLQGIAGNFNNGGYGLMLNSNFLTFREKVNNANAFDEVKFDLSLQAGGFDFAKWHHAAAVNDRGYLRLFLDGVEVANFNIPDITSGVRPVIQYAQNNSFVIGALPTTSTGAVGGFFAGSLDEVSTFNDALTDTVVAEIYNRGTNGDKTAYDVTPPTIPTNLNIIYYNSLVSRANLTVTDCTGLTYIIVTNSKFPPDKNDEDWQLCNTMTGGLLTKELSTSDSYGKLWTKDVFGNISRGFQYVPINTKYDKPIQRPAAHWTFDTAHYNATTRRYIDRLGKIEMQAVTLYSDNAQCDIEHGPATAHLNGHTCWYISPTGGIPPTAGGVLNQKLQLADSQFLRVDNTSTVKPTDKLSVASWVYITQNYDPGAAIAETHIVSTWDAGKGYAIRAVYDPVNPRVEFAVKPVGQPLIAPYLETKNFATGWHLILGTYDAAQGVAKLYVDGIFTKKFTTTPANVEYPAGVKFMVGSNPNSTLYPDGYVHHGDCGAYSCPYTGYAGYKYPNPIDEVLIWNKVLTGLEASSLYHNGADGLYPSDATPPIKPTLALENSRPNIDTNKAYFSLSTCTDISGVLVNEGTRPDKQDDRWQNCRTRLGSFGINNLTPGGHTVTFWFKDLAGNVTPISQDYVVNYLNNPTPRANAYWPMDANQFINGYTRDVISTSKEHEMMVTGINRDNPTAGVTTGQAHEGLNLAGSSYVSLYDGLSLGNSSRLVRPVNYMTVGGWYYLTTNDAATKVLVDNFYNEAGIAGGYKLYLSGSKLNFIVGLDLSVAGSNKVQVQVATNTYATGWHHVLGVWTGDEVKLYIDSVKVATSGILPETNYMRYIDNSSNPLLTFFRIGAESEGTGMVPSNFFNDKVDEQAVWGFDLSQAQVNQAYNYGLSGNALETVADAPDNVDNAYVYYYDSFGSRVRITMLSCANMPYLYVGNYNAVAVQPSATDPDWVDCRTEAGAILSAKLSLGSTPQYVHVWSKNIFGQVSTIPATLEIPVNTEPDTLYLPKSYYSFNANQITSAVSPIDFLGRRSGSITGATTSTAGINQEGLLLASGKYFTTDFNFNLHFQRGFTAGFWAYLLNADATSQILLSPPSDPQALKVYLSGGYLNFNIRRALDAATTTYGYKTDYSGSINSIIDDNFTLSYPTTQITTGWHYVAVSYDMQNMNMYLDGDLISTDNAPRSKWQSLVNRAITISTAPYFRLGDATTPFTNKVDELMMWDVPLTQKELLAHYIRVAHKANSSDVTPPTTAGRTIDVKESTFAVGKWSTEDSKPYITINNCSDVTGIFIKANDNTVPRYDDIGWQGCNTLNGGIQLPTLTNINADNTIYIWIKDAAGNVNAVPLSTVITYNQNPYPTPVMYLSFDNISMNDKFAFDYSPNHLRTEIFGTTSVNHTSASDNAISFDSNRGYARVEASTVYKPTNRLGISYWINPSNLVCNADEHILGTGNKVNGFTVRMDGTTPAGCTSYYGALVFEITLSGVRQNVRIPNAILPGGWMHVVHTFDGRKLFTYINGGAASGGKEYVVDFKTTKTINYDTDQDPLIIGAAPNKLARPAELDEYFSGAIDEVAIFDHALFPHQVTDLYNKGVAGTKIYKPARNLLDNAATLSGLITINSAVNAFTYGSRIKATISNCTDIDLVLVNNSTTQPSATDPDWQPCNTATGGILSAAIGSNLGVPTSISPKLWTRTYDGVVSTNYGTAAAFTFPAKMQDISRPTAYWTLDSLSRGHQDASKIFDFIGNTRSYKPPGFTPSTTSAVTEDGFLFDGFSTYLQATNSPNTNPMINLSVSTWAYLTKGETSLRTIVSNSYGAAGAGIRTNNGQLEFFLYALEQAATTATIDSVKTYFSVNVDTNSYETDWHQITGTYDGKFLRLYLDGVFVNSYQIQFYNTSYRHVIFHDDTTPWMIGANPAATTLSGGVNVTAVQAGSYFNSKVDEVAIFDTTLSETEVYALYLYGSQFKPGVTDNAIAPNDPGVALDPNAATTSQPFAYFTMPSCTAPNGEQINSVYVTVNGAPAPDTFTSGWQHCNLDPRGIISPFLVVGANTITVYLKDNDNDISTPITFTLNYAPPIMPNPMAYWTLDTADLSGATYLDKIGKKNIRSVGDGKGYTGVAAKIAQGYQTIVYNAVPGTPPSYQPMFYNWSIGLNPDKDFATSFWYYTLGYIKNGTLLSKPGVFTIARNAADYITATIITSSGTYTKTSNYKMAPNSWNHLSLTRTGKTAKLFLNSKQILNFLIPDTNLIQSPNQMVFIDTEGILDDVSLFNVGLTDDQVLYNYYLGAKPAPSNLEYAYRPNPQPAPIPTSYWTFDDASIDMTAAPIRSLLDKTGSLPMTIKEDTSNPPTSYLLSSQIGANRKVNQSFFFKRYEDVINNPDADGPGGDPLETENVVGIPQYLEASTPINMYDNFSIAGWVDFTKTTFHAYGSVETYTMIDQWGTAANDQSFSLYQSLPQGPAKRDIVFTFKTTTKGPFTLTASMHQDLSFSVWHHVAVIRKGRIVSMFIDNIESGSIDINTLEPVLVPVTSKLRIANSNQTSDEKRFEGYLDEWAIWNNKALTVEQLDEIYTKGVNGNPLTIVPTAVLANSSSNTTNSVNAPLTLNDCGTYTDVYVGFVGDADPLAGDVGWQTCSTVNAAIQTKTLVAGNNNVRIWFKNGSGVSGYTYDITLNYVVSDNVAPTPPSVTMVTVSPTSSAFATFTLSSCADGADTIYGVYVGTSTSVPTSSQEGWVQCTTNAGGIKSFPLVEGTNNLKLFFKDAAGNIAPMNEAPFPLVYTPPTLPDPKIYLAFTYNGGTQKEFVQTGTYVRDVAQSIPFSIADLINTTFRFNGVVDDAAEFQGNSYVESLTYNPSTVSNIAVAAWVNVPAPGIQSSIINQWDGSAANNRFAVTIDSVGRLCFDFQTTTSVGSSSWSTNVYRHSCSLDKIRFANWTHVAVVRTGTNVTYYINGVQAGVDTIEGSDLKATTLPIRVAGQQRNGGYTIAGQIDEVLLFMNTLSKNQVENIYSRGYNDVSVFDDIEPQEAAIPYAYFDMDNANYNSPSPNMMQTTYPLSGGITFTDQNAGGGTPYTSSITGNVADARYFAGKNALDSNIASLPILNDFSMSVWVKPSIVGNGHAVVNKWEASTAAPTTHTVNQFQLVLDESFGQITTKFYYHTTDSNVWGNAAYSFLSSGTTKFITNNTWSNITITRVGPYLSMYINGELMSMANIGSAQFIDSTQKLRLGGLNLTATGTYVGSIDDFVLWNKGLTERQVMQNYMLGSGTVPAPATTTIKLSAAHHSNTIKATLPNTNAKLTVNDCSTFTDVLVQSASSGQPAAGDGRWVACTTAVGAILSPNLINGNNNLEMWMKTGGVVEATPTATITIIVTP